MKRLTKDQRRNIREILEDKSCVYCKNLFPLVDWWCGNKDAIKARGTSLPRATHCTYFKLDKDYTRKELKIKKPNKSLQKLFNCVVK